MIKFLAPDDHHNVRPSNITSGRSCNTNSKTGRKATAGVGVGSAPHTLKRNMQRNIQKELFDLLSADKKQEHIGAADWVEHKKKMNNLSALNVTEFICQAESTQRAVELSRINKLSNNGLPLHAKGEHQDKNIKHKINYRVAEYFDELAGKRGQKSYAVELFAPELNNEREKLKEKRNQTTHNRISNMSIHSFRKNRYKLLDSVRDDHLSPAQRKACKTKKFTSEVPIPKKGPLIDPEMFRSCEEEEEKQQKHQGIGLELLKEIGQAPITLERLPSTTSRSTSVKNESSCLETPMTTKENFFPSAEEIINNHAHGRRRVHKNSSAASSMRQTSDKESSLRSSREEAPEQDSDTDNFSVSKRSDYGAHAKDLKQTLELPAISEADYRESGPTLNTYETFRDKPSHSKISVGGSEGDRNKFTTEDTHRNNLVAEKIGGRIEGAKLVLPPLTVAGRARRSFRTPQRRDPTHENRSFLISQRSPSASIDPRNNTTIQSRSRSRLRTGHYRQTLLQNRQQNKMRALSEIKTGENQQDILEMKQALAKRTSHFTISNSNSGDMPIRSRKSSSLSKTISKPRFSSYDKPHDKIKLNGYVNYLKDVLGQMQQKFDSFQIEKWKHDVTLENLKDTQGLFSDLNYEGKILQVLYFYKKSSQVIEREEADAAVEEFCSGVKLPNKTAEESLRKKLHELTAQIGKEHKKTFRENWEAEL